MKEKTQSPPWFLLYDKLAKLLYEFYSTCKQENTDPGSVLYNKCISDPEFVTSNKWINKFQVEFGVESLDPFHIFSSISANKLTHENRLRRITILIRLLKSASFDSDIDFAGCPAPAVIRLLGARRKEHQDQIWSFFKRVHEKGRKGIAVSDFEDYKSWFGIDFSSLTTFLFWIESDKFLPIETNIRTFLVASGIRVSAPKTYDSYLELLKFLDRFNYSENSRYGKSGIFREVAHVAYQTIGEGKKEITYSQQLSSLLGGAMRVGPISGSFSMETTISMPEDVDIIVDVETINLIEDKTKDIAEIYRLGFKLIAIRALEDCDDDLLNVLEKNHYYYFERTIEILEGRIVYHPERNLNLYSTKNTPNKIQLNITAIVGKNGSGKSSLIDLLFRMVNNISYASKDWLKTKGLGLIKGLSAELFYVHSGYLYKVIVQDEKIRIQEYLLSGDEFISVPDIGVQEMKKEHFKYLFYTIGINHSQYALNSVEYGDWIRGLFHKNDAYQAPIVLNPMRTKGIVDINKENEFVKSRLLANLLSPVADREDIGLRQITEKQKAIKITFNLQSEKNEILFEREDDTKVPYSKFKDDKAFILKTVADVFNIPADRLAEKSEAVKCAQDYIIRKLVRIAVTYPQYDGYFSKRRIAFLSETKLEDLVKRLKNNSSHVTYKLKQAINYWKYEYWPKTDQFEVDIEAESTRLENFMASVDGKDILEFIPPSIFSSDITLVAEDKIESPFHKLSSGEKQLVYSLSSILYHIKNIDSVNTKDGLIAYSMINIVLDEIELYYHPELQRLFINYLITNIRKLELSEVSALNFCLVTHSPYILSDLTSNYTLKMGEERNSEQMELTFGSNIHDLLANDFFMENGFMGEWAKRKIEEAILFLNFSKLSNQRKAFKKRRLGDLSTPEKFELASIELELKGIMELKLKEEISELEFEETLSKIPFETQDYYKQIINVIGEPLIRIKLKAMYDEEFEQEEIAALDREGKMQRLNELAMELGITLSKNS